MILLLLLGRIYKGEIDKVLYSRGGNDLFPTNGTWAWLDKKVLLPEIGINSTYHCNGPMEVGIGVGDRSESE